MILHAFCGILLDNAIEAAKECNEKIINICIRKDSKSSRQIIIIENTYNEKTIDIEKIFKKGFSSKPNNTGLGLWVVKQIIKKNKNISLITTKDDVYFKQEIDICF